MHHTHRGPKRAAAAPPRALGLIWAAALVTVALAAITGWYAAGAANALGSEPGQGVTTTTAPTTTTATTATSATTTTNSTTTTITAATTTATATTPTATTALVDANGPGAVPAATTPAAAAPTTTTATAPAAPTSTAGAPGSSATSAASIPTTPITTTPITTTPITTTPITTTPTTTTPTTQRSTSSPTTQRATTTGTATTGAVTAVSRQRSGTTQTVRTVTVTVTTPTPAPTLGAAAATSSADPVDADTAAATATAISDPWSTVGVDSASMLAQGNLEDAVASDAPPARLIPVYKAAAGVYGIPWQVLAAINAVESDYGTDTGTSSAGAVGWMQFEPATFAKYEIPTGTTRSPSPYNDVDAIFAAAHLLAANGAATNLRKAIYAYNHASWYVDEVTFLAAEIIGNENRKSASATARIRAMTDAAELLAGTPYVWGGGHGSWSVSDGYDCSGFVSAVLHAAGYLASPQTTQTLPAATGMEGGPGRYVTLFDRTDGAGITDDHVIIDIDGQWWESGGGSGDGGADDVHRIADVSAAYLASFNLELHPKGL